LHTAWAPDGQTFASADPHQLSLWCLPGTVPRVDLDLPAPLLTLGFIDHRAVAVLEDGRVLTIDASAVHETRLEARLAAACLVEGALIGITDALAVQRLTLTS
jgi:hypothetical protein